MKSSMIIPVHWFDERPKLGIRLPFCRANDVDSWKFLKNLITYTKWRFDFFIMRQTRKMESIFNLKDKNTHPSHIIYKGECICCQTPAGRALAKQHVTSSFGLMNIKMLTSNRSQLSTSGNTPTTSSRASFNHLPFMVKKQDKRSVPHRTLPSRTKQTSAITGPHLVLHGNRYYISGITSAI